VTAKELDKLEKGTPVLYDGDLFEFDSIVMQEYYWLKMKGGHYTVAFGADILPVSSLIMELL
jgi:hypothetical protein